MYATMNTYINVSNRTFLNHKTQEDVHSIRSLEILRIALACSGFILNALNIILLQKAWSALRPHMRLILCLNISDLLLSLEVILFFAIHDAPSEVIHCIKFLFKSFETLSVLVVMFILLYIAIDACIATLMPLKYHQIVTVKRTNIALIALWMFGFITILIGTLMSTEHKNDIHETKVYRCYHIKRQYTFFINAALCVLAFPVFMGVYLTIYKNIRKLRGRDSLRGRKMSTKKATLTTLILIFPFLSVYFPVSVYVLMVSIFELKINWPFWDIFMLLVALHTNSDPVICAFRFKILKEGYSTIFCRCYMIKDVVK